LAMLGSGAMRSSVPACPAVGKPGVVAAGHPFARVGMMGFAVLRSTGSIKMARPRRRAALLGYRENGAGGHDSHDLASTSLWVTHEAAAAVGAVGRGCSPRTWWSRRA
jgi:hypothetical protein